MHSFNDTPKNMMDLLYKWKGVGREQARERERKQKECRRPSVAEKELWCGK
jgi:hypothetical protein